MFSSCFKSSASKDSKQQALKLKWFSGNHANVSQPLPPTKFSDKELILFANQLISAIASFKCDESVFGLFRVPGLASKVDAVFSQKLTPKECDVHVLGSALKKTLSNLSFPLMSYSLATKEVDLDYEGLSLEQILLRDICISISEGVIANDKESFVELCGSSVEIFVNLMDLLQVTSVAKTDTFGMDFKSTAMIFIPSIANTREEEKLKAELSHFLSAYNSKERRNNCLEECIIKAGELKQVYDLNRKAVISFFNAMFSSNYINKEDKEMFFQATLGFFPVFNESFGEEESVESENDVIIENESESEYDAEYDMPVSNERKDAKCRVGSQLNKDFNALLSSQKVKQMFQVLSDDDNTHIDKADQVRVLLSEMTSLERASAQKVIDLCEFELDYDFQVEAESDVEDEDAAKIEDQEKVNEVRTSHRLPAADESRMRKAEISYGSEF